MNAVLKGKWPFEWKSSEVQNAFISMRMKTNAKAQVKSSKNKSSCLSSITRGVVAQSPEPEAHVLCVRAFRVELEFRSAGFGI